MSHVSELLGVEYPVIQGAMGVICNPELVAAVSEAGGYGLLATAFATNAQAVRDQVRATKELTNKPFGANLFAMNPKVLEFACVMAEEGIGAVTVSGGSPKQIIPFLRERGIKVLVVVPTVDSACKAEAMGADAIVAEGSESGGVQGFGGPSTMVLVPAVVDKVKVPVVAAGGIGDSRAYRAAMALGAEGVQVGTRFIATKECIAHGNYKNLIVETNDLGTVLINLGRFQVRALRTALTERIVGGETEALSRFGSPAMEDSWVKGHVDQGILPAGQIAGLITDILSVKEVILEMVGC
jgi:enoyl-[acyl-carrier protein] reductase II